ncbi:MAG: regulatory protein RecX [Candidatus Nanopelagicus sp.]
MSIALFALAPRAKSRDELLKQLLKRGVESETANSVLDSLELQGLLNDLEFAKLWSESRQRAKKLSKRVIAGELRAKGVSQDIINEVIEAIDDEAEYRQSFLLAERKYKSISHLDPEVIYRRISGLLARKGYGHGVCAKIMRELSGRN